MELTLSIGTVCMFVCYMYEQAKYKISKFLPNYIMYEHAVSHLTGDFPCFARKSILEIPAGPGRPKPRRVGMQRGAPRDNCACYDGPILVPQSHTKGPKAGLLLWLGQWFDMIDPAQISVPGVFLCSWFPMNPQSRLEQSARSASRFVSHEPAATLSVTYQPTNQPTDAGSLGCPWAE